MCRRRRGGDSDVAIIATHTQLGLATATISAKAHELKVIIGRYVGKHSRLIGNGRLGRARHRRPLLLLLLLLLVVSLLLLLLLMLVLDDLVDAHASSSRDAGLERHGLGTTTERVLVLATTTTTTRLGLLHEPNAQHLDASYCVVVLIAWYEAVDPDEQRRCVYNQQDEVPEPQEREYLLVEQVDGQHALHVVLVAEVFQTQLANLLHTNIKIDHIYM